MTILAIWSPTSRTRCLLRGHPRRPTVGRSRQGHDAVLHLNADGGLFDARVPFEFLEHVFLNLRVVFIAITIVLLIDIVVAIVIVGIRRSGGSRCRGTSPRLLLRLKL